MRNWFKHLHQNSSPIFISIFSGFFSVAAFGMAKRTVLDFEPNNITAREFYPLIEEKLRSK